MMHLRPVASICTRLYSFCVQPPSQGASSWCHRTAPCAGLWTRVGIVCQKRDCILVAALIDYRTRGRADTVSCDCY